MSETVKRTRQGVRDLSYIKGKSVGIRLSIPPQDSMNCPCPVEAMDYDNMTGVSHCRRCKQSYDFDGKPI